ncbi:helix-turn-helix domain-containing protein [Streptomyces sp. x-19]|uniref:helix-turn-helix domain-containing protein n=1 Tax=Streptomyces sp. x-19 TaxID=2789280 RepID=UPI00397F1829
MQVAEALKQGPAAHGFTGQVWTLARIRPVIKETTGAEYTSPSGVWRLLKRHGWPRQIPRHRAYERDEKAVMTWRSEVWPQVKPQPSTAKQ